MYSIFCRKFCIIFCICLLAIFSGYNEKSEASNKKAQEIVNMDVPVGSGIPIELDIPSGQETLMAAEQDTPVQDTPVEDTPVEDTPAEQDMDVGLDDQGIGIGEEEEEGIKHSDSDDFYDATGKTDPFKPLFSEETVRKPRGHEEEGEQKPITPLEKVDLSQLRLTATIMAPSGNRAMVTDSGGKGYVVVRGTYVGINNGRVAQILMYKVIVEEEVENILG